MRHATDADHVVAVAAIVSRERSLRAAAPIGAIWGAGHTATILVVGGAIVVFDVVIPPRLGLAMELSVAIMLILLGAMNLALSARRAHDSTDAAVARFDRRLGRFGAYRLARPLVVGVVHGLAGSAAVAILVLGTIRDPLWALAYLATFGAGTVAGMLLVTTAMAMPLTYAARRFDRLHRGLGVASCLLSVAFGVFLAYRIGFVHSLFTGHPVWAPE
jgi:high-affinity nickel-transport protein